MTDDASHPFADLAGQAPPREAGAAAAPAVPLPPAGAAAATGMRRARATTPWRGHRREEPIAAGNTEDAPSAETAAAAVAAQAEALVRARYAIAYARPRDWDLVRQRILHACRRPRFAMAAIFQKPIGREKIEGASIRFAEEAARSMGNLDLTSMVVFDDQDKRIVRVVATDLESNVSWPKDIVIEKTVEKRTTRPGQVVLTKRTTSRGDVVYLVRATDDDLAIKQAAFESKAQRGAILRLLPADIIEEALDVCRDVRAQADAADPDAARKRVLDAFATIGVSAADIKVYLGTPEAPASLDALLPKQLDELRAIFTAIRDGEAKWADFATTTPAEPTGRGNDALRAELAARGARKAEES